MKFKKSKKAIAVLLFVCVLVAAIYVIETHVNQPLENMPQAFKSDVCTGMSTQMEALNQITLSRRPASAYYIEQLLLGLGDNRTSLSYNVTAVAQNDSYGRGPAYWVNGLSERNMWYQVALSYNWRPGAGFRFLYEVWNGTSRESVFPSSGGAGESNFSMSVQSGDIVRLSLLFRGDWIIMTAIDWESNGSATITFPSFGANVFMGSTQPVSYSSSLMTEWYHVLPFFCSNQVVVYSDRVDPPRSAYLQILEWNFTGIPHQQWFNSSDKRQHLFNIGTSVSPLTGGVTYIEGNGTRIYTNSTDFWTM